MEDILKWRDLIRESSHFEVNEIPLKEASDWLFEDGSIRHKSHRFFNIVGVKFTDIDGQVTYLPLIEQREIGTLGFIWRDTNSVPELLVHAKIEPGNVGIVQFAPSCQATESNADRVHGGDTPPYSDVFGNSEVDIISSSLQSEQGSRFLGKLNRNVLASLRNDKHAKSDIHKWVTVDEVLNMLKVEYTLNTDTRSVLVCSDWEKLTGHKPFSLNDSTFSNELAVSYSHDGLFETVDVLQKRIKALRDRILPPTIVSLIELPNYYCNDYGIFPKKNKPYAIKYIAVQTRYREVKRWNQPIIESIGVGKVDLICARIDGILHFLFKPVIEPGLVYKVELSPSIVVEPGEGWIEEDTQEKKGKVLIECWQSDEGGRFYHDKSLYRIIDVGSKYSVPEGWTWLTVKQIKALLKNGGWLTNEARSAISLLLTWL